ncbi:MAG TPA: hypothetical protein DCX68_02470 [Marinobacter hydrocarbonoclasticus]|jgi:hypothetical protein|uniref:PilZ domain-containing protein n=1 Tax=Marinobacter nauticus TaxID=2743 RepID=A0A368Y294_MARNT|nr:MULTISPECIES: hypothetical protein [Marinobacter]MCS5565750.1 hypothetical protein [Methylococcales bacterium]MEC9039232.1 hypothetical protein [Pseudomonadota bacterium]ERS12111.1 hypothetical protein Q673_00460 [Marinobacter sp. EN3]ERS90477.1 hypothetical protein Q667_09665 [Marinobacter sp. C1S70]MAL32778.1 hypothetical protein [Marinobacter sp.]|tara:strand:- start:275 stop:673 length:399 start_codon:yes stop_codon:yes gene_type:complete
MNEELPDLVARFRIRHGIFRKETVEARLYELDSYGCVMKTDKLFEPGDTVVLDLVMDMPFEEIRAEGLTGLVTEKRKHCSNFFYSLDFVELNARDESPLSDKLRRIREVVLKKQSLKSRRGSSPASGMRQMA